MQDKEKDLSKKIQREQKGDCVMGNDGSGNYGYRDKQVEYSANIVAHGMILLFNMWLKENDIPDIIERYNNLENERNRERTEQSFFVPKQEIVDNDYDLSINKYKKVEYKPVEYPPTSEIMAELRELEKQIKAEMAAKN